MNGSPSSAHGTHLTGYWSPQTWKRRGGESVVTPFAAVNLTKGGGYELRMGREAFTTALGKRVVLTESEVDVEIPPGQFALLLTKERVRIPKDSIGFISVKFSLKAKGMINVSGFHVDPGYDGWLTFSVFNAGPNAITVSRDEPCFLLWLAHWDEPLEDSHLYPSGTVGARGSTERLSDGMVDNLKGEFSSPASLKQEIEAYKKMQSKILWWGGTIGTIVVFVVGVIVGAVITNVVDRSFTKLIGGDTSSASISAGVVPSAASHGQGTAPTPLPGALPAGHNP